MTGPPYRDTTGAYGPPQLVNVRDGRIVGGRKSRATTVALDGPATPASIALVAELLSGLTRKRLMITTNNKEPNLDFLASLPPLHALTVLRTDTQDLGVLAEHADALEELHLELGRGSVAVEPLGALPHLRRLYLRKTGPGSVKAAPEALAEASALEHLVLHSITLPTVAPLTVLPVLRGLALKLGSAPDLTAFPELLALRFFEAWQVRGLSDLSPVATSRTLEVLYLESLRRATLPNFSGAVSLQHVQVDNLPLTEGLAGLAAAPSLRQLSISRRVFEPEEVKVLRGHPTLEAAWIPIRGRGVSEEEMRLGLAHPHRAPFVAFGAGVMGLPPEGWDGNYLMN